MSERLNKVLAHAGVASRRAADRLIEEGRVSVNGRVVDEPGSRVDPIEDAIKVDGKRIGAAPTTSVYWMLNKPRGYVTTLDDPQGRPTVRELLTRVRRRVYPVGRLDFHTEGLLLFTDDGDLCRVLLHPSSQVPKTYAAKVRGVPDSTVLARLAAGVPLDGRKVLVRGVRAVRVGENSWVELTVYEGRKHLVRRLLQAVGHPVLRLRRIGYAGLRLGALAPAAARPLSPREVARLRRSGEPSPPRGRAG